MQLAEVLLTEVSDGADPGVRSTRPAGLCIVAYLRADEQGERYTGAAAVTLPAGVQSPWNFRVLAQALEELARALLGTAVEPVGRDSADVGAALTRTVEQVVMAQAGTAEQRAAVSCVHTAVRVAAADLLAGAGRDPERERIPTPVQVVEVLPPRGSAAGPSDDAVPVSVDLPQVTTWMGRCAWDRTEPTPDPWGPAPDRHEYEDLGLENLGKNSLDSYLLEREARRLGLATVRFRGVDFHAEDRAGRSIGFHCTTGPSTSRYVTKICDDKQVTRRLLDRAGVTIPTGRLFGPDDRTKALAFARSLGWPVVVKPASGHGGTGVAANIQAEDAVEQAFARLADAGQARIIVERHVPGADYRFFVVGEQVVSVVHRRPAGVVGDGRSTVAELVLAKNRFRQRNPHLRTRLIRLDRQALRLLQERGMTPTSVPAAGERLPLAVTANLSRGADSVEVLDETHPSLVEMAVRAVGAVAGLDHAGVDVIAEDHRRPAWKQQAAVCELNSLPGSTSHHYPVFGPSRNVSAALVEHYAGWRGLHTESQPDVVSVAMQVTGTVQEVGYRRWFADLAGQLGLSGWVSRGAGPEVVQASVTGPLDLVTAATVQAMFGPAGAGPELVETEVTAESHSGGFGIRS